jgi:hypothetical protein
MIVCIRLSPSAINIVSTPSFGCIIPQPIVGAQTDYVSISTRLAAPFLVRTAPL